MPWLDGTSASRSAAELERRLIDAMPTLKWAPPVLENPIVFIPDTSGYSGRNLDAKGADVLVLMSRTTVQTNSPGSVGCLRVDNARNLVLQGGQCDSPLTTGNEIQRSAIVLVGVTGVAHIEGVLAGSDTSYVSNGIEVYSSPTGIVQVQNCEFIVRATDEVNFTDGHPDGIFIDSGASALGTLRVDRCRFDTDYQGLSILTTNCSVDVDRLHIVIREKGQAASTQGFWQHDNTDPIAIGSQVYLTKRASQTYGLSVHPDSTDGTTARRPTVSATDISWPTEPTITGGILQGDPPFDMVATDRGLLYRARASAPATNITGAIPTVASAATITLNKRYPVVKVSGTTGITSITASDTTRQVTIIFTGILTVTDGSNLKLNGNLTTAANTTLTLVSDGANWYEVARSVN